MKTQIFPYPVVMPKRKYQLPEIKEPFGKRLARLRKSAGHSQYTFADEVGISKRMIAYYEIQTTHPPTHLLPVFAKVLGVSADQLLGMVKVKEVKGRDSRLRRRIEEIEKLPAAQRKQIAQYLDTFLKAWKNEDGKSY